LELIDWAAATEHVFLPPLLQTSLFYLNLQLLRACLKQVQQHCLPAQQRLATELHPAVHPSSHPKPLPPPGRHRSELRAATDLPRSL
jgi:hypothetical protein